MKNDSNKIIFNNSFNNQNNKNEKEKENNIRNKKHYKTINAKHNFNINSDEKTEITPNKLTNNKINQNPKNNSLKMKRPKSGNESNISLLKKELPMNNKNDKKEGMLNIYKNIFNNTNTIFKQTPKNNYIYLKKFKRNNSNIINEINHRNNNNKDKENEKLLNINNVNINKKENNKDNNKDKDKENKKVKINNQDRNIKNNNFNTIFTDITNRNNFHINYKPYNEFDIKNIIENNKIYEKAKKNLEIFLYTKHYGDKNKCSMCQSMEMKAKYLENKIGLYKDHICKDKEKNNNIKITNFSNNKNNIFPSIKITEEKKENNFEINRELSPIYSKKDINYSLCNIKSQFTFNLLKKRFQRKTHKFEIIDFPVLNNYFNS